MKSEYIVSRKEAIKRNVNDIKQAAKEWGYSLQDSYDDWKNEGFNPDWVKIGVKNLLGLS